MDLRRSKKTPLFNIMSFLTLTGVLNGARMYFPFHTFCSLENELHTAGVNLNHLFKVKIKILTGFGSLNSVLGSPIYFRMGGGRVA